MELLIKNRAVTFSLNILFIFESQYFNQRKTTAKYLLLIRYFFRSSLSNQWGTTFSTSSSLVGIPMPSSSLENRLRHPTRDLFQRDSNPQTDPKIGLTPGPCSIGDGGSRGVLLSVKNALLKCFELFL